MIAIIVHGGAGRITKRVGHKKGVVDAVKIGYKVLKNSGTAVDAVEKAVICMENNPIFNAGTGSALDINGEAEMDAAIMKDNSECGAVAIIKNIKNPISVARKVMEETDHILLSGEGANKFAKLMGFKYHNPITERRKKLLTKGLKEMKKGKSLRYLPKLKHFVKKHNLGTVGAVALDEHGHIAVATSTGGLMYRLPGRIGDTPMIGAGTYANQYGGASATGHGECIMRLCLSKVVVDFMKICTPQSAINKAIDIATKYDCKCGIVGMDRKGNIGFGYNTKLMSYVSIKDGKIKVFGH